MKLTRVTDALHVDKKEGSSVDYFLFPEYEVHYNEIKPGTIQQWHHHNKITESIFVVDGEIEVHWVDMSGKKQVESVPKGTVIDVENTPHTFINNSDELVKFVVFRFVPDGVDKSEIIKNDKILDNDLG